jgi:hypothetical protein
MGISNDQQISAQITHLQAVRRRLKKTVSLYNKEAELVENPSGLRPIFSAILSALQPIMHRNRTAQAYSQLI